MERCPLPARREFGCVLKQIADELRHPGWIDRRPQWAVRHVRLEANTQLAEQRSVVFGCTPDEIREIDPLMPDRNLPACDSRDVEQVVDQATEILGLPVDHIAGAVRIR